MWVSSATFPSAHDVHQKFVCFIPVTSFQCERSANIIINSTAHLRGGKRLCHAAVDVTNRNIFVFRNVFKKTGIII